VIGSNAVPIDRKSIANNDYPQAIEFYAREMKNYKDLVKSNKNDYLLSDRITLWFNNWTNDFGNPIEFVNWV
jgi:hypothetical protein